MLIGIGPPVPPPRMAGLEQLKTPVAQLAPQVCQSAATRNSCTCCSARMSALDTRARTEARDGPAGGTSHVALLICRVCTPVSNHVAFTCPLRGFTP